jgi:hypothetical protein
LRGLGEQKSLFGPKSERPERTADPEQRTRYFFVGRRVARQLPAAHRTREQKHHTTLADDVAAQ